jgi:hypothetical protein
MASSEEEKARQAKRIKMQQARQSWLDAVKRNAHQSTVPLSCFRYLWDLGQEHSRVAVRRAALHLYGSLLQKSAECRMHVSSDDLLLKWVTCVVEAKNLKASSSSLETQVSCWQAEALEWLNYLSQSHGDLYPKFRVARQFLQQRTLAGNSSIITQGNHGANMADLRRIRDIAMKYGNAEIGKVDKLILKSHKCLDVLVPRIGMDVANETPSVSAESTVVADNDDDDDDDIEWEDGDEEFDEATTAAEDHAEAVERTLAAMEASAGGMQGGHIEINLESNEESPDDAAMDENTRKLLQKTVRLIETRHMKRLTSWVDALVKADGLVLKEKSLVIMPADVARKRSELLQKLLNRKQTLASILASAAKLGVSVDANNSVAASGTLQLAAAAATNVPPPRQRAVLATAARRRYDTKVARRRSNKLQIKYRTS